MHSTSRQNKWATLIGCSLSCLLGTLDFGIVNTAIPAIQQELRASFIELQWVMNAYTLAFIMMVVMNGRLADLWGRRLINLCGVILFGVSSLFAGLSTSSDLLIFWRFIQGIAISAVLPSALALITHAFAENERGKAIGLWTSITGLGIAFGPVLSGILVSTLGWRWIFYINIPFVLISLGITLLFVKESKDETAKKKIDPKGMVLLAMGLFLLVSAFINAPDWKWGSLHTLSYLGLGCVVLFAFYFSEMRSKYPTIEFHLFTNLTFFSCTLILFCSLCFLAVTFFLAPLYLQIIRHEAPYITGLMLLPITGCIILFSPLIGHLVDKFSAKKLMLIGLALFLVGGIFQSMLHSKSSPAFIIASFILIGLGFTFARTPATTTGLGALPSRLAGTASGAVWTIQNIGSVMGIAIGVTLFRQEYEISSTPETFLIGYRHAMGALCILVFLTATTVLFSMRGKPVSHR